MSFVEGWLACSEDCSSTIIDWIWLIKGWPCFVEGWSDTVADWTNFVEG